MIVGRHRAARAASDRRANPPIDEKPASVTAELDSMRGRVDRAEEYLRVVAAWLGVPRLSKPADVVELARQKGAELDSLRDQLRHERGRAAEVTSLRQLAEQRRARLIELAGAALERDGAFARGWQAAREAAASFHDERARLADDRRAHLEANPGLVPDGVREGVIEAEKESAAQDRTDAHYLRSLPIPEDAAGAVRDAEEGLRRDLAASLELVQENVRLVRAQRDRMKGQRDDLRAIIRRLHDAVGCDSGEPHDQGACAVDGAEAAARDRAKLLDEVNAKIRELHALNALRNVLDHAVISHPLPWRVEQDWTWEVTAADGAVVAKCQTCAEAQAVVSAAEAFHAWLTTEAPDAR